VAGKCVGDVIGSKAPGQSIYPVIQPTKFGLSSISRSSGHQVILNHPYVGAATSALRLSFRRFRDMAVLRKGSNICVPTVETPESDTTYRIVLPTRIAMGLIELIVTVCALSLPSQCEDQHFSFLADMSLNQCVMSAPPYIAQWTNEHPGWVAVRWGCDYGGSKEKT
jgi:hypothetical protein